MVFYNNIFFKQFLQLQIIGSSNSLFNNQLQLRKNLFIKSMMFINQQRPVTFKMDNLFFNSIQKAKNSYVNKIIWHICKLALLSIFLIIDTKVLKTQQIQLVVAMFFGIITSIINSAINAIIFGVGYSNNLQNNQFFLKVAQAVSHISTQQRIADPIDVNDLAKCVSDTLYNYNTGIQNNDPALTQQIKYKYQIISKNLIQGQVFQRYKFFIIDILGRLCSLSSVIFGIVGLVTSQPSWYQIVVLSLYILLESYNVWGIIFVIVCLIFSPLICCIGCCYLMCRRTTVFIDRNSLSIPQTTYATAQIIQETDAKCTICLQNFILNQKVKRLGCSPKHTFHQNCILSWLRVSNSCPICRTPLPQTI